MKLTFSRKAINTIILALNYYIAHTRTYNDRADAMVIRHKLVNL